MDDSRIKDVSTLLSAFFDEDKLRKGSQYARFFGGWKEIAGERLAAHSKVAEVEKGFLIIEAEHPGWIQLLQLRQAEFLDAVRRRFPELELRGIQFRLIRPSAKDSSGTGAQFPASSGQDTELETEASGLSRGTDEARVPGSDVQIPVEDPKLKALLESLQRTINGGNGKK